MMRPVSFSWNESFRIIHMNGEQATEKGKEFESQDSTSSQSIFASWLICPITIPVIKSTAEKKLNDYCFFPQNWTLSGSPNLTKGKAMAKWYIIREWSHITHWWQLSSDPQGMPSSCCPLYPSACAHSVWHWKKKEIPCSNSSDVGNTSQCTDLMRWGFMNSVRTEPRISFWPYSTRESSPALKIMHTYQNNWGEGSIIRCLWEQDNSRQDSHFHCQNRTSHYQHILAKEPVRPTIT